jgi:hypothetical protein
MEEKKLHTLTQVAAEGGQEQENRRICEDSEVAT